MATITEDYVSFEVAKLLVKKSFDYNAEYESYYTLGGTIVYFKDNPQDINIAPRITLQMAMKWLREVYGLFIMVDCGVGAYVWSIADMSNGNVILKVDAVVGSYEQTCEAAIKYCLENLI